MGEQVLLVVLALAQLGLTGLGIDVIRNHVDCPAAPPVHWPFGWTPTGWSPLGQVGLIAGTILGLALVHAALRFRAAITVSNLVLRIVVQLRTEVYDKLQRLSFRFFDANQSGSIINRVAGDVQAVRMFIDGVIIQVLTVALSLAVYLAYMLSVHVPLTLACLATTPLLWWAAVRFSRTRAARVFAQQRVDRSAGAGAVGKYPGRAGRQRLRPRRSSKSKNSRPPIGPLAIRCTGFSAGSASSSR